MSTCKDCLHWDACKNMLEAMGHIVDGDGENADQRCNDFTDKSRFVELPCKIGDTVYRIYAKCDCPGDCYAKRTCKGCEYRDVYVEEQSFDFGMLCSNGKLNPVYCLTREAAECGAPMKGESK